MQVVATSTGFHDGARRRVGEVFHMDESKFKKGKDGKPRTPSWVKPVADVTAAKKEAEAARRAEADRQKAGALAASGGAVAKSKVDAMRDLAG